MEGTSVIWTIEPAQNGTHDVLFSHEGWPEQLHAKELASVNYTWGRICGRLKKYVETGKPVPYFP